MSVARRVDVIVIGSGAAGLAAAVSAAEKDLKVVVLEKEARLGGTTMWSVGSLTASNSALQRKAGIVDEDPDAFAQDMVAFRPELLRDDAPQLRRLYARESGATVDWLLGLGVSFAGPYLEPPHRIPRMHNVIPGSRAYVDRLARAARRLGVVILRDARVVRVSPGSAPSVVVADSSGVERQLTAVRGVVLATGDFSANRTMRMEHLDDDAAPAQPINPHADGSGHELAATVGAELRGMNITFGPQLRFPEPPRPGLISRLPTWPWLTRIEAAVVQHLPPGALRPFVKSLLITHMSPTPELFTEGAVLINTSGKRFCNEIESVTQLSHQPQGKGFIVLDERIGTRFDTSAAISTAPGIAFAHLSDYRRGRPDLVHTAPEATALAFKLGVPAGALASTVEQSSLEGGLIALGPLYSMITVTEGSIRIDDELRVLDTTGSPLPGLYAVGGVGQGGMLLLGHGHHIGWALTSGRFLGCQLAASGASEV
ncbi:MAG: FAD-dependent oxidoreductase [Dehalococcoidia bacterium]